MTSRPARRPVGTRSAALALAGALVLSLVVPTVALAPAGVSTTVGSRAGARAGSSGRAAKCPPTSASKAPEGPSERAVVAQEAQGGRLAVDLVRYPRPSTAGDPWSQWGQGLVLPDGRFLSAIGNHLGKEGNSYLYVFDPETRELTRFADVRSAAEGALDFGYGKVHGQIVPGPCGDAYFATYWGTRTGLTYTDRYRGDLLFRIDPASHTITSLGAPVEEQGIPSLAATPDGTLLYGEGVDPFASAEAGRDVGSFFVYDPVAREVVFRDDRAQHTGYRNILVDRDGNAYVAAGGGQLLRYDRETGRLADAGVKLPGGGWLRASTPPAPDGTVYGVTTQPNRFFALGPDGTVTDLGPAPAYIASLALAPDGSRVYFVPDAHGGSVDEGTPLLALDPEMREVTELARLDDLTREAFGLRAGGSYNLAVDPSAGRLYVGLNAGPTADDPWGEVVLAVVQLDVRAVGGRPATTATTKPRANGKQKPQKRAGRASAAAGALAAVCRPAGGSAVVHKAPTAGTSGGIALEDVTAARGLDDPLTGMRAHAVAIGDVNGDGWTDLFVGTFADRPAAEYRQRGASGPAPDRLLLGGPDGFRVDESFPGTRGRTSGAAFADLDGDGDLDLVVTRNVRAGGGPASAPTTIYRNDAGTFVEAGTLREPAGARSVGLLDYDGDGRLDLFIGEDRFAGGSSVLLRNAGDLRFEDVTAVAGMPRDVAGMGVGTADFDGDGRPDLFVGGANRLFLNRDGRFVEQEGAVPSWPTHGAEDDPAGVAVGDVDGDGRPDLVIGQHYNSTVDAGQRVPVRLYLNEPGRDGGVRLRDVTEAAGLVGLPTKSPHVEIADLDADGRVDIVTTAAARDGRTPVVFRNVGVDAGTPRFEAVSSPGSTQYWVTGAVFDADHDGRLDVLLAEWEPSRASVLLRGTGDTGHWLAVGGRPGTTVEVFAAGRLGERTERVVAATIGTSTGYSAGPADHAWLGLGDRTRVDLRVTRPGAKPVEVRNAKVDRAVTCAPAITAGPR